LHQALWEVLGGLQAMSLEGERSVRLVVTSRMDLAGRLGGAPQVHLGSMPAADAQQLLLLRAGKDVRWKEGHAAQLAEMCGGNALAFTLVGGVFATSRCTPKVRCRAAGGTAPSLQPPLGLWRQ
jgi:thiamine monophosphate synthase